MPPGYSNLSERPPGRFLSLAARLLPGVRAVQDQVLPYAAAWRDHNAAALAATGPLWVALGDSMTQGIGAGAYERGWVGQVAARMPGWRVVNLAISGGIVRDVLDRQLPALDALAAPPDLLTVMIGSNDMFNPRHRPHLAADLAELLERLPPGTVVGNQPGTFAPALEINRLIDDAVARRGLVLAEFRDPRTRTWRGKLAADHFHPNERGYASMAAIMEEAIRRR
ncbi:SGNH/GDSL hydrolase family protein [Pseudonocardia sp.]|uniref:SGNH/GDSL hydrolase family protein n=1 Tax=Pseudonocardia sp. TaxID=60912 RepID=UPI00262A2E78|nr:SGNH/GDSL hydrolase family protein [Pseudonocardia sp.]